VYASHVSVFFSLLTYSMFNINLHSFNIHYKIQLRNKYMTSGLGKTLYQLNNRQFFFISLIYIVQMSSKLNKNRYADMQPQLLYVPNSVSFKMC